MFSHMDITRVLANPRLCAATIGMTPGSFTALLAQFEQTVISDYYEQKHIRDYGGGRRGKIRNPLQKLFFILFYLKCYPTVDTAAYVFASSKSAVHEWIHDILPLLEKTLGRSFDLPKRRISSPEEFFELFPGVREVMIDGVERPTIRSKKNKTQGKHYSGKKKRHTRKNVVVADTTKRILALSPSKHGRVHDKKQLDKMELHIPNDVYILADTGFVGLQKQHTRVLLPEKKPKGGVLTQLQKDMNHLISSTRIVVEHAIGGMKRFACVSSIYRNKNGLDDMFALITAGLWNFRLRYA
jgi:DDE superfamily endonuclease/Helix-turn-helix of DDE superfamily endonuclease